MKLYKSSFINPKNNHVIRGLDLADNIEEVGQENAVDITEEFPININKMITALENAGFGETEITVIELLVKEGYEGAYYEA